MSLDPDVEEYHLLSEKLHRHASFPYQVVPIAITVAGGLLVLGGKSGFFVGPGVTIGLLFLSIAWAISHAQVLYFGQRLIKLENEMTGGKLRAWKTTLCKPPPGFEIYVLLILFLVILLFGFTLFYSWVELNDSLRNEYCKYEWLGNKYCMFADYAKEIAWVFVVVALIVAIVVALVVLRNQFIFEAIYCCKFNDKPSIHCRLICAIPLIRWILHVKKKTWKEICNKQTNNAKGDSECRDTRDA